jgi:hypothetical protein
MPKAIVSHLARIFFPSLGSNDRPHPRLRRIQSSAGVPPTTAAKEAHRISETIVSWSLGDIRNFVNITSE